ncbi:MAG: prephenate dehydrogenase [Nocardioidaceae bacterium]|nr:prephenate dehydrogenase [Nocardioidaceae bacterium]
MSRAVSERPALDGPVLVVGAGLIGGSVAMALSRAGIEVFITDVDRRAAHVASSRGAGSEEAPDPDRVRLVVVATPPDHLGSEIIAALETYPRAVVTDVGSVKAQAWAEVAGSRADARRYVGGHPMAGSERSGPMASAPDLFEGRAWAVVRRDDCNAAAVASVRALVEACGATVVEMAADDHDTAVARVSHLPHLVAVLAAGSLADAPRNHLALSGQGVRDVTRVAAGDPELWRQIVLANAEALTLLLTQVRDGIDDLVESLGTGDGERLEKILRAGVAGTEAIPGKHGGATRLFATVNVSIPDEPGALARLFADAGEAGVNIEDLRIDHDPGRAFGLVEIDVAERRAESLIDALRARNWSVHR